MGTDPLKRPLNRAEQTKIDPQYQGGIRLYDIDLTIANHMIDTVTPTIEMNDEKIKIPVFYGNPERWKAVKRDGVLRDRDGKLNLPLIMFKRNSINADDSMPNAMNRQLSYPGVSKYSKEHRYDAFSKMSGIKRPVETYNVTIPDYVTITYEVIIWTDFIEQMNKVIEAYQYATDTFWGDRDGFKFMTKIDSFDNTTEVGEGSERIVRTSFTMMVNAYMLPEKFNNEPTTTKSYSIKQIRWGDETIL